MRKYAIGFVPFLLLPIACGEAADRARSGDGGAGGVEATGGANSGGTSPTGSGGASSGGSGDTLDFPNDDHSDEDATVDDTLDPTVTEPTQLTADDGAMIGITSDDRIVYGTDGAVWSIKAAPTAPSRKVASTAGNTYIAGRTVFTFHDLDYDAGTGKLTFWTPPIGRRSVGEALLGERQVKARHDDAYVLFALDVRSTTLDVVVSSADTEQAQILLDDVPRGGESTCAPSYGFAGDDVIAAWCSEGTYTATLARFSLEQGRWEREDIATDAKPVWASDPAGKTLFYVAGGEGWADDGSGAISLGSGVGWGTVRPDGQVVYFTVGDQLRRSDLSGSPIPIVVDSFGEAVDWSENMDVVVYSDEFDYEDGAKQDLMGTPTSWFNSSPSVFVGSPTAVTDRSAVTEDGAHALYLTNVDTSGGTLHVAPTDGGSEVTVAGVDSVLATKGGELLFTDNRTGMDPALADLHVYDAATVDGPTLIEADIVDGRDVQLRSDRETIALRREGGDDDGGIWLRPIP